MTQLKQTIYLCRRFCLIQSAIPTRWPKLIDNEGFQIIQRRRFAQYSERDYTVSLRRLTHRERCHTSPCLLHSVGRLQQDWFKRNQTSLFIRGLSKGISHEESRYDHKDEAHNEKHFLKEVHQAWIQKLTEASVSEPEDSVNFIVAHVCGKKMIHEVNLNAYVTKDVIEDIDRMGQKRIQRVPVQYIIGEWDFHDMTLKMEPGVLIPRPETEELGLHVVNNLLEDDIQTCYNVLDIGCGTGALSLYILKSLPNVRCTALDKDKKACDVTKQNAEHYFLLDRLRIVQGDIFKDECIESLLDSGPYDVIVSNPPYIPTKEMAALEPEVSRYENSDALCGGTDGLDVIRQILELSRQLLKPEVGLLYLEVHLSHPDQIEQIVKTNPHYNLHYLETIQDFTRRDRFCKLQIKVG